ncbi:MAG: N-acetylglucosamine kinase [Actinomycetes bacterium]
MSDKVVHLAVDVGQSSTKLRLGGAGRRRELVAPGVTPGTPLLQQWIDILQPALAELDAPVHTVAIGSNSVGRETAHDLLPALLDAGVHRVVVAHDSVTCYLGALGDEHGCVITAGTGTICLAVGPREIARVDGWGHIVGDAGSAYWIGRTALEAALRGYDGRRQLTALTRMMAEEFEDIELAYLDLQSSPRRVARIASFAARVDELAASDRVAGNILDKAAAHLSEAVQAGLRRVQLVGPQTPRVAVLGGVFRSARVLRRFTDYLTLQWPSFALTEPKGAGIDGAERLVDLSPSHPLYPGLSVAER